MHYSALVELRGIEPRREPGLGLPATIEPALVEHALEQAMAPFYSDCSGGYRTINPGTDQEDYVELDADEWTCEHRGHHWDWYVVAGRYPDFFQSVPEPSALPFQGIDAARSYNDFARRIPGGHLEDEPERDGYDVILKRDVDWEAMAARKMQQAAGWWDEYQADPTPWNRLNFDVEEDETRDEYIRRQTHGRTYTIRTADGLWVPRETFVYVPDGESHFEEEPDWDRKWDEIVSNMPDDAVLAIVDYHN
jgi:hypothetical protein